MKKQFLVLSLILLTPSLTAKIGGNIKADLLSQAMTINRIDNLLMVTSIKTNSIMKFLNSKFNYNLSQDELSSIDRVRNFHKSAQDDLKKQWLDAIKTGK